VEVTYSHLHLSRNPTKPYTSWCRRLRRTKVVGLARLQEISLILKHLDGTYNPFTGYSYTGTLRPAYPLSSTRKVPDHIPRPDYAEHGLYSNYSLTSHQLRTHALTRTTVIGGEAIWTTPAYIVKRGTRKDADSVSREFPCTYNRLSDSVTTTQLAREVLDIAASHVRPGITTDEIDEIVHNATIERNAYPSPLNYRNFPKSVCT
jgi:methionyl aminopeptidase